MKKIKTLTLIVFLLVTGVISVYSASDSDRHPISSIIMFKGAPNPCDRKCLIRLYLPENDVNASIKVLSADSSLVKEISLAGVSGINSAMVYVADMQNGTYICQLYYKNEARSSQLLKVAH